MTEFTRICRALVAGALVLACGSLLAAPVDAPELAVPGAHAVGVRTFRIDAGPGLDGREARKLDALIWYPAAKPAGQQGGKLASHSLARSLAGHPWRGWSSPVRIDTPSTAAPDLAPISEGAFPVVVLSHGLLGWAESMAYLAEHLASRGYAVVGVQHEDERAGDPLRAALALRALDHWAAIGAIDQMNAEPGGALRGRLATDRVALVGYSMGGYGALVAAGARVPEASAAARYAAAPALARSVAALNTTDGERASRVAAVVALAPWGAQPAFGALAAPGLGTLSMPVLLIAGDEDDISGYEDGARAVWQSLVRAPRWLLTYENARHNIGHDAAPATLAAANFRRWEAFEEPVWRRDRILDINRHFITAFLDTHFRGVAASAKWLELATLRAGKGQWKVPFGTPNNGEFAGVASGERTHWIGFQRRWALGLRLEKLEATPPK